ncbi:unnamed protein product, partial [Timema podura]|nr:unnamed protein product [Timema podura]
MKTIPCLYQAGAIETRVLRLTNPCCLPLTYRYRKVACLEVKPTGATLRANSALEVVVSVKPVSIGTVHTSLVLELLSPECPSIKDSKYMIVGRRTLTISYNAPSVTILPKIVFNLGISPLRGNEVGFLTGDVRPWPRLETCDVMERGEPEDRATWTGVKVPLQCQGQLFLIDSGLSEMDSDVMNRGEIKIILTLSPSTLGSLRLVLSSPSSDISEAQCRRTEAGKRSVAKPPRARGQTTTPPTSWPHYVVLKTEEGPTKEQRSFGVRTESLGRAREEMPDCTGVVKGRRNRWIGGGTTTGKEETTKTVDRRRMKKNQDALIAFPNDTTYSFRSSHKDNIRTIFKGAPRYCPPLDPRFAYTPEEVKLKEEHEDSWLHYMRSKARATQEQLAKERKIALPDYELSCPDLPQVTDARPPKVAPHSRMKASVGKKDSLFIGDVNVPLNPMHLYNVKVTPFSINFGKVAPNSYSPQVLDLENLNPFPIKVRVFPGRTGVEFPNGDTRVVKPFMKNTLDMVFKTETLGRYNGFMNYVINGNHSFEITIFAEVVKKTLLLSPTELSFDTTDLAFQTRCMSVSLTNSLQSLHQVPVGGPGELSLQRPANDRRSFSTEDPHVLSVLQSGRSFMTMMYNADYEDMVFSVENPEPMPGCEVTPESGMIRARGVLFLTLEMKLGAVIDFRFNVTVSLQRSTSIHLRVMGCVGYPKVVIKPDVLRLRRISVDSFDTQRLTAENKGSVPAAIQFALEDFPEYRISCSPSRSSAELVPRDFLLPPGRKDNFYLHFTPVDVATYEFLLPVVINDILGPPIMDKPLTQRPQKYGKLGQLRPLSIPTRLPNVRVDYTVAGHVIRFSKLTFKLTKMPWPDMKERTEDSLTIRNECRDPVMFVIRLDDLIPGRSPFTLEHHSGVCPDISDKALSATLKLGEQVILRVLFRPEGPGVFKVVAPIFVREHKEGDVFNHLNITGVFPYPSIRSPIREVHFLPIPLSVDSELNTFIVTSFYPSDNRAKAIVKSMLGNIDTHQVPVTLKVDFYDGNAIRAGEKASILPLKITFRSEVPTAFNTTIVFTDEDHLGQYSMLVTAVADNCLLTTHSFLRTQAERFYLDSQNAPEDKDNNIRSPSRVRGITFVGTGVIQRVKSFNLRLMSNSSILAKGISAFQSDLSVFSMVSTVMGVSDSSEFNPTSSHTTPSTCRSQAETNNNPYPKFPDPFDDMDYALHMRKVLDAVETWLYEQGFRCSFSASLPEGMANMVGSVVTRWRSFKPKKSESSSRTIIDLLGNLVRSKVVQSFSKREFPSENLARVEYVCSMYEHLISFLTAQGACIVHLPEHLLNYDDYTCYIEQIQPFLKTTPMKEKEKSTVQENKECSKSPRQSGVKPQIKKEKLDVISEGMEKKGKAAPAQLVKILDKEEFEMISKQAWMDIILQIHKTLVLAKVTYASMKDSWHPVPGTTPSVQSTVSSVVSLTSSGDMQPHTRSKTTDHLASNVYSQPERILLTWLSSHFMTQREKLWEGALPPRDVTTFDRDLQDGLVLAAVTTVFCPYLTSIYFHDLYLNPQTPEQKYHNAVRLTDAWCSVVLGFTVKPEDIVMPCAVKLLMLT